MYSETILDNPLLMKTSMPNSHAKQPVLFLLAHCKHGCQTSHTKHACSPNKLKKHKTQPCHAAPFSRQSKHACQPGIRSSPVFQPSLPGMTKNPPHLAAMFPNHAKRACHVVIQSSSGMLSNRPLPFTNSPNQPCKAAVPSSSVYQLSLSGMTDSHLGHPSRPAKQTRHAKHPYTGALFTNQAERA